LNSIVVGFLASATVSIGVFVSIDIFVAGVGIGLFYCIKFFSSSNWARLLFFFAKWSFKKFQDSRQKQKENPTMMICLRSNWPLKFCS